MDVFYYRRTRQKAKTQWVFSSHRPNVQTNESQPASREEFQINMIVLCEILILC